MKWLIVTGAGVPSGVAGSNRTDWSISGGSLKLDLHHPWTYIFVNVGLGENVTNFNFTLTQGAMWNETGNGTLCMPSLALPSGLTPSDGQHATLQVVTLGASGQALYNCADITFRNNVSPFGGQDCTTDSNVNFTVVNQEFNGSTTSTGGGGQSAGSSSGVDRVALTSVVGLAVAFLYGMCL